MRFGIFDNTGWAQKHMKRQRESLQFGGDFKFNIKACICRQVGGLCKTMDGRSDKHRV